MLRTTKIRFVIETEWDAEPPTTRAQVSTPAGDGSTIERSLEEWLELEWGADVARVTTCEETSV